MGHLLWTLLFGLTAMYRYLSAAYTFSIAIVCVLLSSKLPVSFLQLREVKRVRLYPCYFTRRMLIVEGLLISKTQ